MLRDDLEDAFICIWGLGLMGGSLAMALKPHCREIVGIDNKPDVVERALDLGIVSKASTKPQDILPDVDVIVLSVPVGVILQIVSELPALCTTPVVVFDLGSTKADIVDAYKSLPEHIYPVAGHPMSGKSVLGLEHADPSVYADAPFMLYPLPRSQGKAFNLIKKIVKAVGADPLVVEPDVHDRWVAATSHLPYLVSSALALSVPEEAAPLISSGFTSTSRLAETPTSMMLDVLKTNRTNLLEVLDDFQTQLDVLVAGLEAEDMHALETVLNTAARVRGRLLGIAERGAT